MDRADFKGRKEIAAQNVFLLRFPVPHLEVFPVVSQNADATNWYLVKFFAHIAEPLRALRAILLSASTQTAPRNAENAKRKPQFLGSFNLSSAPCS